MNEILYNKSKVSSLNQEIPSLVENGILITDPKDIANAINNFFVEVGQHSEADSYMNVAQTVTRITEDPNYQKILFPTTVEEVIEVIKGLKNKYNVTVSSLTNKLLKYCVLELAEPISEIVNLSFKEGSFPELCKRARVIPIFKAGDTGDPGNYRPIALLSALSKVIEKLAKKRILQFLNGKSFFNKNQFGYLEGRGIDDALFQIVNGIQQTLDSGGVAAGLFLDLSKAFDSIDHRILLNEMQSVGFESSDLKWLQSYLQGRKQLVFVNGVESEWLEVKSGVPQGSILGPILFLVYINKLPALDLYGKPVQYADDTNLFYAGDSYGEIIQNMGKDLEIVDTWLEEINLHLNLKKTSAICFSKPGCKLEKPELWYKNSKILYATSLKFLGLHIDEHLTWKAHINKVIQKIVPVSKAFTRIRNYLTDEMKRSLYFAVVHSHLGFLSHVWGHCNDGDLQRLMVIQNRTIKILFKLHPRTPSVDVYSSLKIVPINKLIKIKSALHLVKNFSSPSSDLRVLMGVDIHNYHTRSRHTLRVPEIPLSATYGTNNILNQAIFYYNKIPLNIRTESELKIKKYLLNVV